MKALVAVVSPKRGGASGPAAELLEQYVTRASLYIPCSQRIFPSEARLLECVSSMAARTRPALILADGRGQQLTSIELSGLIGTFMDAGTQQLIVGVGPADGWSQTALDRADRTIAFGRITLPHELAAVVCAEQLYRALTIRAGHPYHSGH